MTLAVEGLDVAHSQPIVLGPEAEAEAPAELRDRLADTVRRTAALYG